MYRNIIDLLAQTFRVTVLSGIGSSTVYILSKVLATIFHRV